MNRSQLFFGILFLGVAFLIFASPYIFPGPEQDLEILEKNTWIDTVSYTPKMMFGYSVDSLDVFEEKVKRNQNLATILSKYNVDSKTIFELSRATKGVFDLKKIHPNKKFSFLCYQDSLRTLKAAVYEPSKVEYIVFHVEDSIYVSKVVKQTEIVQKTATGVISSSLAMSMIDLELPPTLTNEFADIFAWQIDFFHLYPGDKFKVIYEEEQIDGERIKISEIKGAYFQHSGNDYYAVYYDQGNGFDYFDEDGNSLRKALLRYPVKFSRISSRYSGRRYHPVQKRYKAHRGTDFAAPGGTPIRSVGDGIIVEAKYGKFNGNFVKVKHNGNYTTGYLHMKKFARGIRPGVKVKQGQIIGFVGKTGLAKGNHVCFRFWKNGVQIDALKVKLPPSEPILKENRAEYDIFNERMITALDILSYPEDQILMAKIGE
jgi:murein DD-endopeptidase MepM/ murein hydrolase activator NlpD